MRKNRDKASVSAKRWAAYAIAGSAAALGPQITEADIIFREPNAALRDTDPDNGYFHTAYAATFGTPGAALIFMAGYSETGPIQGVLAAQGSLSASAPQSFQLSIAGSKVSGTFFYPSNLNYFQNISTLSFFSAGNRGDMAWGRGYPYSQFIDTGGFIAFRFDIGNGTQYGWAELEIDSASPANLFTLTSYAYTDDGLPLYAGQTSRGVPEPGSLGFLAMGAGGLLAWRRNRKLTR